MTKFELTDITMEYEGVTLHRVKYDDGSLGGWIEKPENIAGNAKVYENARVFGDAEVYENARVFGDAEVFGSVEVYGSAVVRGNVEVYGAAKVYGDAVVYGDAIVKSLEDYIVFKNWWSSGRYFTWTRSNNMWRVGCFYGTGEELIERAHQGSEISGREYERVVRYVESLLSESTEGGIKK